MPLPPARRMRVRVSAKLVRAVADLALFRGRRTRMAGAAVLLGIARRVWIRMGIYFRLVTHHTSRSLGGTGVAPKAMVVLPPRIVGLRLGHGMTRNAGVLLVTDRAARAIPIRPDAVGLQAPQVVVRLRHHRLMAFATGFFAMTHATHHVVLRTERTMPPCPVPVVTSRRGFWIHIHMTSFAVQAPPMYLIAQLHLGAVRLLRDAFGLCLQKLPMTVIAPIGQNLGVYKNPTRLADRLNRSLARENLQILYLVTHPAGLLADGLGFDPVTVALYAGFMPGCYKTALGYLAMAILARHPVFLDVEVVAEGQRIVVLIAARKQDQPRQQEPHLA